MIAIKIQCACGQRYAFDVEPAEDLVFGGVFCPVCGADGTAAANAVLAQQERVPVRGVLAAAASPLPTAAAVRTIAATPAVQRITAPPPAPRAVSAAASLPLSAPVPSSPGRLPGQLAPEQARLEARAKIMWGDDPGEVAKFLLTHGYSAEEAKATIGPILDERAASIRKAGVHKILTGAGMMCVPVVAFIIFKSVGILPLKIFGATIVVGAWGAWRVISGTIMFLSPRSEKGDVSEM